MRLQKLQKLQHKKPQITAKTQYQCNTTVTSVTFCNKCNL